MFDVCVIGGGVVGGLIARKLSSYNLKICILEKENDVACGATKANSAIVHAGFDAEAGSLKALLNVKGSEMMKKTAEELGVKYINNGSLVIAFDDDDIKMLEVLKERGEKNGVKGLEILNSERAHAMEPLLSENVKAAMYAPTGAIICPYELCIAAIGNAMDNGAVLKTNFSVCEIPQNNGEYTIKSEKGESVSTKYIVNAAGIYADYIASLYNDTSFKVTPRRGEYILLDKSVECVKTTVFRTPSKMGKGILVSPTVDGNTILGPTSENIDDKEDKTTTLSGLNKIISEERMNLKKVETGKAITSFCGLRAAGDTGDFIIKREGNIITLAGIESPGLSASPAIAEYVSELLGEVCELIKNKSFNPLRSPAHFYKNLSDEEKNELIKKNSSYGKVVCRCENVTEGEILDAIRSNPPAKDLDGVKRRTRAQMGRCQGGFCSPYIIDILANEMNVSADEITKNGEGSYITTGRTKEMQL